MRTVGTCLLLAAGLALLGLASGCAPAPYYETVIIIPVPDPLPPPPPPCPPDPGPIWDPAPMPAPAPVHDTGSTVATKTRETSSTKTRGDVLAAPTTQERPTVGTRTPSGGSSSPGTTTGKPRGTNGGATKGTKRGR